MLYLIVPHLRFYFPRIESTPNRTIATPRGTAGRTTYLTYTARYRALAERMMDPSKVFATSSAKTNQTPYDRLQAPF